MERVVTVKFGPSRSKRFGKAVAEAESGVGACCEVEPGKYRVSFVLGEDPAAYACLARLLERVRHWRATEVYEDDEPVSTFHARVVVLDDASTDRSQEAVLDFLDEHAHLPGMLLQHVVNRGLGRTRNDLVEAARGELVFMLDADNEVYPTALDRLVEALDADPEALFAYSMLEEHVDGRPDTLRSYLPWELGQLAESNYIDAMSLLRRRELLELGGYTEDSRLHGWEDYDLWCRTAEHGLRGVLVPEVLARYRRADHSMLYSITNIDTSEAESLLRARYPILTRTRPDELGER